MITQIHPDTVVTQRSYFNTNYDFKIVYATAYAKPKSGLGPFRHCLYIHLNKDYPIFGRLVDKAKFKQYKKVTFNGTYETYCRDVLTEEGIKLPNEVTLTQINYNAFAMSTEVIIGVDFNHFPAETEYTQQPIVDEILDEIIPTLITQLKNEPKN